ncbi:DUF1659 domain-containing protein [Falsibacillus pallidus]|uniref:Uncharacterized protein DUF1659 n=1 Tax=Falsibacillus pallidus TaxID=493781 RepID=A0A370GPI8_9BACI|nr:DUF1659 domain-containing protein [Falsibacillus pallidus]RDI45642.1 uncharacterized protein DUF1659 [Falsibacillus pallidus]
MAEALLKDSKLKLMFQAGVDENGDPVFKNKTLNNIKTDSTPDQLDQVAQALKALCSSPLVEVERDDSYDIEA